MPKDFSRIDLYAIIDHLVVSAKLKDEENLREWNYAFTIVSREVFSSPISLEDMEYSDCRNTALLELYHHFEGSDREKFHKALDEKLMKISIPNLLN